ncbi:MAG: HlyD family efflux transporter periplasmic adaptor subunit, partial [Actinomycetota bacterium]|nr:HlyD family efflux transporter periplasmic adaptor subunit [Actinomycetota bacterium]
QTVSAAQLGVAQASQQLSAAEAPPPSTALAQDASAVTQAAVSVRQAALGLAQARAPTAAALDTASAAVQAASAGVTVARAQLAESQAPPRPSTLQPLVAAAYQAMVAVSNAQATIDGATLTAPITGTIVSVSAVTNERVGTGTPIAVLESATLGIDASLAQADLSLVRPGQSALVAVPGAPSELQATVTAVGVAATPGVTSFPVTLTAKTDPAWLRSGEVVAATIVTRSYPSATLIPDGAIVSVSGTSQVFVVLRGRRGHPAAGHRPAHPARRPAAHRARRRSAHGSGHVGRVRLVGVHVEVTDGTTAMVSGVPAGTEVVTLGQTYLANRAKVRVVGTVPVAGSVAGSSVGGLAVPSTPLAGGRGAAHAGGRPGPAGGGKGGTGGRGLGG